MFIHQYPDTEGTVMDFTEVVRRAKESGVSVFNQ